MESDMPVRFTLLKQSSLAPERDSESLDDVDGEHDFGDVSDIDPGLRLMFLANEGELEGIKELLDSGADVNFRDIDYRTALHVAACQGNHGVAKLLIENGAELDLKDRWGSTVWLDSETIHVEFVILVNSVSLMDLFLAFYSWFTISFSSWKLLVM